MNSVVIFFRNHKKSIIVGSSILLLAVCLGAYSAWSYAVWSTYTTNYETRQKDTQSSLDKALVKKTNKDRLAALVEVDEAISSASSCQINSFAAWQSTVFPSLRDKKASCQHVADRMHLLEGKTKNLADYLKNEQQLISTLSTSDLKKTEVTEAGLAAQAAAWQSAADAAKDMRVTTNFTPLKEQASTSLSLLAQVWKDILNAHTAKDKAKYTEATGRVVAAYAGLLELDSINKKQYQAALEDLKSSNPL